MDRQVRIILISETFVADHISSLLTFLGRMILSKWVPTTFDMPYPSESFSFDLNVSPSTFPRGIWFGIQKQKQINTKDRSKLAKSHAEKSSRSDWSPSPQLQWCVIFGLALVYWESTCSLRVVWDFIF